MKKTIFALATYAPAPGYVVYQGYGAPYPAGCPGGYWGPPAAA